jgi:DNA-binding NarL/FixJ family response regulator
MVREATRQILQQGPDLTVTGEAGDGEEDLKLIARKKPGGKV